MNFQRCVAILLSLCLSGCLASHSGEDRLSHQMNVFGVQLYSSTDYREIGGVKATEEPCLRGYERSFDPLEISVGYGFDGTIRKVTTRNPGTSLFGIHPGMSLVEAKRLVWQAGLTDTASPFTFQGESLTLTLLVDGNGKVFGITVEALK